ncbi:MAG: pyridoxamine 5'-phosphate oxidase family protein [Acidimicrobiales bacterium]
MSRRDLIRMTPDEVEAFLGGKHTMNVATLSPSGQPHLVAMWYGFLDGAPALWTYSRSQKVMNLRRDPRITCLVETGDTYDTLRGVELVGTGAILEDAAAITQVGQSVYSRYFGVVDELSRPIVERMGAKRVVVRIDVVSVVSWDHAKLGGVY